MKLNTDTIFNERVAARVPVRAPGVEPAWLTRGEWERLRSHWELYFTSSYDGAKYFSGPGVEVSVCYSPPMEGFEEAFGVFRER